MSAVEPVHDEDGGRRRRQTPWCRRQQSHRGSRVDPGDRDHELPRRADDRRAVTLVDAASRAWQSDIGREVTIEVRPLQGGKVDEEIAKAVALARSFRASAGARA